MANICSVHHPSLGPVEGCEACNTDVMDFLRDQFGGDPHKQFLDAEYAGLHKCECGFEYYNTVNFCPLCYKERQMVCPVEAIVAIDQDYGYAKDGNIPWHYSEDFKWFQQQTKGCVGLMGSKTYKYINEKLGEKAKVSVLPGRTIFVLSNSLTDLPNATVVRTVEEFFYQAAPLKPNKIMFMGGAAVYNLGLPFCDTVHVTRIHNRYSCDSFFPEIEYIDEAFDQTYVKEGPEFNIETWTRAKRDF